MSNYTISGTLSANAVIYLSIDNRFIGYKECSAGAYNCVFSYFSHDTFNDLNTNLWHISTNGGADTPTLVSKGVKLRAPANTGSNVCTSQISSYHGGGDDWYLQGDFDIEVAAEDFSSAASDSQQLKLEVRRDNNDAVYIAHEYNSSVNFIKYTSNGDVYDAITTHNITDDRPMNRLRLIRVSDSITAYMINDYAWLSLNSTNHLGTDDVRVSISVNRWSAAVETYSTVTDFEIHSVDDLSVSRNFKVDVSARNVATGQLMGAGNVTPISTSSAVNIIQVG